MVLKSTLKETIAEVLEEHEIDDADLLEDVVDRLQSVIEVMDDDDEESDEESEPQVFGEDLED